MNDQALIPIPVSPFLSAFREAAHRVFRHKNNIFNPNSSTVRSPHCVLGLSDLR